jgi:phosphopantothenoylcysteine decarboxylase/phosphopantothenate--cysteine ligase
MENKKRIKRVLLCVGGGFQAYAIPGFVLSLLKHVADDVQVVLSRTAAKLTSAYAIEVASRHAVFTEVSDSAEGIYVPHIELAISCDVIIVYPATVSVMGKVAQGIADDLISAIILATERPVFFVPATNEAMWRHPAVQRNVQFLRDDGYEIQPMIAEVEVATREGLSQSTTEFPFPTLLPKLFAASASSSPVGRVRRKRNEA